MIDGCLILAVWCQIGHQMASNSVFNSSPITSTTPSQTQASRGLKGPCDPGYNFIPVAFAIMLYVVYLMECWHCRTRMELNSQIDIATIYDTIRKLREAFPVVWWRAVTYHYSRKTRQVTRYRNGDAVTTTQVYYERINSHTAGHVFLYHEAGVKDISKKLTNLERHAMTRIRFTKGFVFANLQAANEFEEQRTRFFQENEQRDDYMEVREGLDLLNQPFQDSVIAFASPSRRPFYTLQWMFWLCSFFLFSWFLRVLLEYKTAYVHYQITKLFGTNYLSPSSEHYTGPITRVDTLESRELEAAMQQQQANNYFIVPSYSEALLMDPASTRTQVVQDSQGNVHVTARQRYHRGGSTNTLCNESVFPNYGALLMHEGVPLVIPGTPRSQSMSFQRPRSGSGHSPSHRFATASSRQGADGESASSSGRASVRSFSFGNLIYLNRGTAVAPATNPTSEDEPPPPYEVALQLCKPLYAKIKRSLSSLDKFRFRSNDKVGPSSNDDTPL